jgi:hypothetical protein
MLRYRSRRHTLLLALAGAALPVLLVAAPASAETPLTLSPASVRPGDTVSATLALPAVEAPSNSVTPTDGPGGGTNLHLLRGLAAPPADCVVTLDDASMDPTGCDVGDAQATVTFVVPAGTKAGPHGVTVTVNEVLGTGTLEVRHPLVTVPDVVGLATDDARERLSQAFLTLRTPRGQGRIATQNPTPGTAVEPGSAVLVTFAAVVVTPPSPPSSPPPRGRTPPPQSSSARPTPSPSATTTEQTEPTSSRVNGIAGGLLALVVAFVIGHLVTRLRSRRSGPIPPTPPVPGASSASPAIPHQGHAPRPASQPSRRSAPVVGVQARSDHSAAPRLIDPAELPDLRVGVRAVADTHVEPVLVEDPS